MALRTRALLLVLMAVFSLSGCGGTGDPVSGSRREATRFKASDGVRLEGRLFGGGSVGIVLSHQGNPDDNQTQWFAVADRLAEHGYLVLTYNTRGICPRGGAGCSRGAYDLSKNWMDIIGAYRFLKSRGAERVVLMGASVGAMGSLVAAGKPGIQAAAVVAISGR